MAGWQNSVCTASMNLTVIYTHKKMLGHMAHSRDTGYELVVKCQSAE